MPEFIQEQATPIALKEAVAGQIFEPAKAQALQAAFREIHEALRQDASKRAAEAVIDVAGRPA